MMKAKKERTLVIIKPDGVQRSLVGEIISRFERAGLKIVALKISVAKKEQIKKQYGPTKKEILALGKRSIENQKRLGIEIKKSPLEQGMAILNRLEKFMRAGPIVAMVLEGNCATKVVKKLVGTTEPATSDVGTIRGDFTIDSYSMADANERAVRNLIHCSGSEEEAEREIKIWFKPKEILNYKLISEKILDDVNLDGIFE